MGLLGWILFSNLLKPLLLLIFISALKSNDLKKVHKSTIVPFQLAESLLRLRPFQTKFADLHNPFTLPLLLQTISFLRSIRRFIQSPITASLPLLHHSIMLLILYFISMIFATTQQQTSMATCLIACTPISGSPLAPAHMPPLSKSLSTKTQTT